MILTDERWQHILSEHGEVACRDRILELVAHPKHTAGGRTHRETWFYGDGFGPTGYVKVVVHYDDEVGSITTAFPRRRFP